MVYISPYKPIRSLIDKFNAYASLSVPEDTPPLMAAASIPKPPPLFTNEYLALNGCKRCGERAVCATHAKGHDLFSVIETAQISIVENEPLSIISNFEQINYMQNQPQLVLKEEDKRRLKIFEERNKMDVDDTPFCCSNIKILNRESTMRDTDPDFRILKTLLDGADDPERIVMRLNVVPAHQLRKIKTVYKVNVYGRHVPFDAHSTWLFAQEPHDDDDPGENDDVFYGFMYCEFLQPFSSIKRYITAGCAGEHKGSRYYRIGVYDADWHWNGNRPLFGTFGDQNLDPVMRMPVKRRVKRVRDGNMTMNAYFQGSSQAEEEDEAISLM